MIQKVADFIVFLLELLPDDPLLNGLQKHLEAVSGYMGYINYFVPFYGILNILTVWCAGLFSYYMFVTNKELLLNLLDHLLDAARRFVSKLFGTGGGET